MTEIWRWRGDPEEVAVDTININTVCEQSQKKWKISDRGSGSKPVDHLLPYRILISLSKTLLSAFDESDFSLTNY
jgi:hypothetical protein